MKTKFLTQSRNGVLVLAFLLLSLNILAQSEKPVIAEVLLLKVDPQNVAEFEKQIKDVWKPINQGRKQSGRIVFWQAYKVHYTGTASPYNYVGLSVYDDWKKTEPNENMADMFKAALPKADMNAIMARARAIVQIYGTSQYERVDGVYKPDTRARYVVMNFMKVKEGMNDAYIASETKDWKPIHKEMVDTGKRAGWGLWALAFPGGTSNTHDYVTTDNYETYPQMFESQMDAFKKAYPNQEVTPFIQKTEKTRSIVKQELWELMETTN